MTRTWRTRLLVLMRFVKSEIATHRQTAQRAGIKGDG
jgi:hypothetical protein